MRSDERAGRKAVRRREYQRAGERDERKWPLSSLGPSNFRFQVHHVGYVRNVLL